MCGIAGVLNLEEQPRPTEQTIRRMLGMIRHRGPDEFGILLDGSIALGNARLSTVDLLSGQQPICNEDGTKWIVYNGEVFNDAEIRRELEQKGHRFKTHCDTEVVLHAYEEFGPDCLNKLNGQFAIAIWDSRSQSLFLARDRLGVRPLFYGIADGALVFASEIKAIFGEGRLTPRLDHVALDQVFTFWSPLFSHTAFQGISEIPPGHYLLARPPEIQIVPYWQLQFPVATASRAELSGREERDRVDQLGALLDDAARLRLRGDVQVGAYLSGGLDSAAVAALAREHVGHRLHTFSIAFDDTQFDESAHQLRMAKHLGTKHHFIHASHADIGSVFPDVVWHAETPLMRTAPAPMFLLSGLVRSRNFKVVLSGEGADEFLAGYDIFKEARIRRFWARQPQSKARFLLFKRLYADIAGLRNANAAYLAAFFGEGLAEVRQPCYSHLVRWRNNRRACRFFSDEVNLSAARSMDDAIESIRLPSRFAEYDPLHQAQHLEIVVFLSQYLLSAQGDRMAMAHSIEARFPFLDHRVVEFCNQLPPSLKLRGLKEKFALRQVARRWLPPEIVERTKRPYRAPIHRCFFGKTAPDYVRELLSPASLRETGLFKPAAVAALVSKLDQGRPLGETDDMALAGILSTQLLHSQFVARFRKTEPIGNHDRVKVCHGPSAGGRA